VLKPLHYYNTLAEPLFDRYQLCKNRNIISLSTVSSLGTMEVNGKVQEPISLIKEARMCQLCLEGGDGIAAETYCRVCKEFLCFTCSNVHRRSKASRNHELIDRDEVGTALPEQSKENESEYCVEHPTELLKYFCKEHKSLHCGDCIVFKKHLCDMLKISDIANGYKSSDGYKKLQTWNNSRIDSARQIKENINKMTVNTKQAEKRSKEEVMMHGDKMIKELNERIGELTAQITSESLNIQSSLFKLGQICETVESNAQQLARTLEENANDDVLLFITSHISHKSENELYSLPKTLVDVEEECKQVPTYEFEVNHAIEVALRSTSCIGVYRQNGAELPPCISADECNTNTG